MEDNTLLRSVFVAYFYCLYKNPIRHKFLIKKKKVFNKREYAVYSILERLIEEDTLPIDHATVYYEMKIAGGTFDKSSNINSLLIDFEYIIRNAEADKYNIDKLNIYYNTLLAEYRIDLFRNAKSEKDIVNAITESEQINELTDSVYVNASDAFQMLMNDELAIDKLNTRLSLFDDKIFLANGILLLAGGRGSSKTSLMVELMKRILVNHNKDKHIAIHWNTMEDEIRMIIAKMISREVGIPARQLIRSNSKLKQHHKIKTLETIIGKFDIEFQDKQLSITEIKTNWKAFLKQRKTIDNPDKPVFPILIIDNIMQLTDHGTKVNQTADDDFICNQINICRNEAKKIFGNQYLIVILHHTGKENLNKTNLRNAYIPDDSTIKGSSRYTDMPTLGLLVHWFGVKQDFLDEMQPFDKYLKNLVFISCFKNRQGGWIGNDRLWSDLDYNYFENYLINKENAV